MDRQTRTQVKKTNRPRVLTEKRKEQNRLHQKLYREKKKQLQQRPTHVSTANEQFASLQDDDPILVLNDPKLPATTIVELSQDWNELPDMSSIVTLQESLETAAWNLEEPDSNFLGNLPDQDSRISLVAAPYTESYEQPSQENHVNATSSADSIIPPRNEHPIIRTELLEGLDLNDISESRSIEYSSSKNQTTRNEVADLKEIEQRIQLGQLTVQDVFQAGMRAILDSQKPQKFNEASARQVAHVEHSPGRSSTFSMARFGRDRGPQKIETNDLYLADPFINHIRLHQVNLIKACVANAHMLGSSWTVETDVGCVSIQPSEFNRRMQMYGDAKVVLDCFRTHVSTDLVPCLAQIEQPHYLFVDLFPFPEFRKRIMETRTIQPPLYNERELLEDIDSHGLVCWGKGGSCTPWDMRSWEAKPWFLKKWWMLCGGPEGEMYKQSKWYWNLHDEEHDLELI